MPSNLFVVVFPRRVQAHTVVVDKKERAPARRGWSVGGLREGLRSPPGLLGRDGKTGKGDTGAGQNQGAGRDNASCGSPTSRSSSRDGSAMTHHGAASVSHAARNELKNQKTVRVQLSRPTEDMEPEPGMPKKNRRGSQLLHHRTESNQGSWTASSNHSLARTDSAMSASVGGAVGGGAGGASEWASEVLKEHKKPRSFIHIPSRSSKDLGNGNASGRSMEDIFGEVDRSSRASTCEGLTTADSGVGVGGRGRGRSSSICGSTVTGVRKQHKKSASASSWSSLRGLIDDDDVAVDVGPEGDSGEAEAAVGSVGTATAAVVKKKEMDAPAAKPQQRGVGEEDQLVKVPADDGVPAAPVTGAGEDTTDREEARGVPASPPPAPALRQKSRRGDEHDGEAPVEREAGEGQGHADERKDAEEGGSSGWEARRASAAPSTPGSKRRLVTEVIGDDDVDVSRPQDRDEGEKVDIEKLVRGILVEMRGDMLLIGEPTYHVSASGKLMTCIFPCDVEDAHLVLTRLESVGVGSETGSVNVLPMEIGRSDITRRRREIGKVDEDKARRTRHNRATGGRFGDSSGGGADGEKDDDAARRANERFRALASQIRVTQVTEEIREGTKCHFDYMALLVASSAISAMGLATDNVAVVVAAMLVSPIMGPVLAFTFGTNVRDWSLAKKGFLVESFSLLICIGVGFLVGIVGVNFIKADTWPTHEMETRGNAWGLLTGICIAIPSGMAVALSILSKNVNSLVGVAISASLLPPAVNTGLCLAVALIGPAVTSFHIDVTNYVMIALISMSLTIVNIVSIYFSGVWLFIFKEVAPIKSENSFWSQDMIHARKFQQKLGKSGGEGGEAAHHLRKTLLEAANRGASSGDSGIPTSDSYIERKGSFSSNTNTHHRYRHKDRRRRPTVFDLFPDMGDETSPLDEGGGGNTPAGTPATGLRDSLKHAPVGARESIKTETGRLLGLMTKFLERGDDNKGDSSNNAMAAGDDENAHRREPLI